MILEFQIYTLFEEKLFIKNFHQVISPDQTTIINKTIPSLIKVIKNLFSINSTNSKVFSIAGLNIYFKILNENIYIIITSIGSIASIFDDFIKKIDTSIKEILSLEPIFDLNSNHYFLRKLESLKILAENKILGKKQSQIEEKSQTISVMRQSLVNKSKNKYLIMGAAAAGKSSIIAQFFESWKQEQLLNIKPTVLNAIRQFNDNYTKESFLIRDLAGQAVYRKKHLEDPKNFENVNCLIYVIDIEETNNFSIVQTYFLDILNKLKTQKQNPLVSIFLHKFDPSIREKISNQLLFWIEWLEEIFSKEEYRSLHLNFHLSSILDSTAKEALARTLLFTLPHWFLGQTIQNELIIKSTNSLYPVFGQFHKVLTEIEQDQIKNELYQASYLFGLEVANEIVSNWIKYMIKDEEFIKSFNLNNQISDVEIRTFEEEKKIEFCFKCPLKEELKVHPSMCEITHGLFQGVGQLIGFPSAKMKTTQIRNKSEYCIIDLSY
ncbi:MAG: hypothetical protein HeimC3_25230 [Candidatus Heimdallarchaeota archaeon LC_3]|nr:MAG: hypothetical protein HeimC3_25230 [Candidatus Heimdallarchaeota archaeon LC_3]